MSRQFAILGLGYFGITLAEELVRKHNQVLGVDRSETRVNEFADLFSHTVAADITDEKALAELSLGDYDAVIIDVDDNIEASMVCTMLAKEQGAQEVWAKAHSDTHYRLLKQLGADHVVYPERDIGMRVAESLHYHALVDFIRLGERQFIVEFQTTERLTERCHTIGDLGLDDANLALIAIRRGDGLEKAPDNDAPLKPHDHLVLMGDLEDLRNLGKKL
ncbi:potassium channel family protein [Modicisalibacter luteus]|uniref:Potassium channel family protein n=1 Tax=Modicisalibacter luteus TaxID=453962 RepID=A0ABV7LZZ4_9GAMM|nr:TrkA family potassium uptake protein [Halomonas lutea]GHA97377.1 potassium transporter KtrA [Halomonas lutea]